MKTSPSKEKETKSERQVPLTEMADNALKNYEHAVRTGLRLQEEASRWWTSTFSQAAATTDWQRRATEYASMANNFMPLAQKRMEEMLEIVEKNSRSGADLVKKAMDAAQTPVLAESQAKWMDFWTAAMNTMRTNTDAMSTLGGHAIDSWLNFVRKNTEITEVRVPKAAAA